MKLDPIIRTAIENAVNREGQPKTLATKLIAWYESLANGNEGFDDRDNVARHLELLYSAVKVDSSIHHNSEEDNP